MVDFAKKYRLDMKEGVDYRILENHPFARRVGSEIVVIGRKVYCRGQLEEIPRHEYLHLAQYKKFGTVLVLLHYWFYVTVNLIRTRNFRKAFLEVPFEREAREYEAIKDTTN